MICDVRNVASQRGMQKAGLTPHGRIFRLAFNYLPGETVFTLRGHRWMRPGANHAAAPDRSPSDA